MTTLLMTFMAYGPPPIAVANPMREAGHIVTNSRDGWVVDFRVLNRSAQGRSDVTDRLAIFPF